MLEFITLDNPERWDAIIRSMNYYDFYHLAEYHRLDNSGTPLLLYWKGHTVEFALPVILKSIAGTVYQDITSAYGYVGPLANIENPDVKSVQAFQQALHHFFDTHLIVSGFSRLHPLFPAQKAIFSGLGEVVDTNLTVGINLKLPESEQRRQYAHSLKNAINRLKKKDLLVTPAQTRAEIDSFVEVYEENMKRVHAFPKYFFPKEYFYQFLETINSTLLLVVYENKIISGSLFTECNGIIQPHLSATRSEYLYLSPLKYLWDCIRIIGKEKNENFLHLGGGFGGKNDSLFGFKSQFSKQYFVFQTWRYIHNQAVYDQLLGETFKNEAAELSYFPLYRFNTND